MYNILTWKQKAIIFSKKLKVVDYNHKGLNDLVNQIHIYSYIKNGVSKLLADLLDVGVKFIYVSHLSKTYLDGAAFHYENNPIIALTGRYNRLDNFFFTLAHEIFHVLNDLNNDSSNSIFVDDTVKGGGIKISIKEKKANKNAGRVLLKDKIYEYFSGSIHYLPYDKVMEFSRENKLHPSIMMGILAFNKPNMPFSAVQRYADTIRDKIPSKYKADLI